MDTTYDIWLNELRMFRRTRIIVRTPGDQPAGSRLPARLPARTRADAA
jgi:hypothetical protein